MNHLERITERLCIGGGIILFFVPLLLLLGCEIDSRPQATGPDDEVTVVMDEEHWEGELGEAVRYEIADYVMTHPVPEPPFELQPLSIQDEQTLNQIRARKNVLIVAPLSDTTYEAQFLQSLLSEDAREAVTDGGTAVVSRRDLWRRGQNVFFVTANSAEELIQTVADDADSIRDTFNVAIQERVRNDMFNRGRQYDLEEELMENHGFAVNAQADFQAAIDTTNFVWLRRILSDTERSFFVYYEEDADPGDLSPEWAIAKRDSLGQAYFHGSLGGWIEIDQRGPLETREIDFNGRYGYEIRGLWGMFGEDDDGRRFPWGMGGSFVSYAVYDEPSGRIYLIDGAVFAPGHGNHRFLRQMEAMATTFRTREEMDGSVAQQAD